MNYTKIMLGIHRVNRLLERYQKSACEKHGLTVTEGAILAFLKNNPALDTAKDIVELRNIPKANVSQAVEALIRKGMLRRKPDTEDRRRIHLELVPASSPAISDIDEAREQLLSCLLRGFDREELALMGSMSERILKNAEDEKG